MKFNMNLLPEMYVGLKRDMVSIFIAIGLFVVTILLNSAGYLLVYSQEKKITWSVFDPALEVSKVETETNKYTRELKKLDAEIKKPIISKEEKMKLQERIIFVNQFLGGLYVSWYDFFEKLELLSPERIWIINHTLNLERGIPELQLEARAESHVEVNNFWTNLENAVDFTDVQLEKEVEVKNGDQKYFEFKINFKYIPIIDIKIEPQRTERVVGTTFPFEVKGQNIIGDNVNIDSGWPKWEVHSEQANIGKVNNRGEFTALEPGECILRAYSDDRKLMAEAKIIVSKID